jgi:type VI secretion system protein ImpB
MANSFQKEKPPARINLFLELEKGDAQEKVELPLRMLMLGDYLGREDHTPLEDREALNVTSDNFDAIMESMDLRLEYTVPDRLREGDREISVDLEIEDMDDFSPERVAHQVPELTRMLAMRNLLQDLRNRVVSTSQFRKKLEEIVHNPDALGRLVEELNQVVPPAADGDAAADDAAEPDA